MIGIAVWMLGCVEADTIVTSESDGDRVTEVTWRGGHRVREIETDGVATTDVTWTWDGEELVAQHFETTESDGGVLVWDRTYTRDEAGNVAVIDSLR